jgi:hypothetical protein
MVTGAAAVDPVSGGRTTVQVSWSGQVTGAAWPSTSAAIWPDELMKFVPVKVTLCPAEPVDGSRVESTGGPPGSAGTVEVGVDVDDVAPSPDELPVGTVFGVEGGVPGPAVVEVDRPDAWLPPSERVPTMAATTTTRSTAVRPMAHRSRRSPVPSARGRRPRTGTRGSGQEDAWAEAKGPIDPAASGDRVPPGGVDVPAPVRTRPCA